MAYADTVNALSPASYWKLDEASGTFADQRPAAITGTAVNNGSFSYSQTRLIENDAGTSISVTNTNGDAITFGDNYDFTGSAAFTALAWIHLNTYNSATGHYIWGNLDGSVRGWYVFLGNPAVTINVARGDNAGFDVVTHAVSEASIEGSTHFVGIIYDGTNLKVGYDGAFVNSAASSKSLVAPTTSTLLNLGRYGGGGSGFDGRLDEPAIWSSALSEAQFLSIYNAGLAQILLPDADTATGGWTTAPLFSKVNDSSDATVITATAS